MATSKLDLTKFKFEISFTKKFKILFYDYLYIRALSKNEELASEILKYNYFADTEFNQKTISF